MKLPPFILALLLATTAQAETNQAVLKHVESLGGRVRRVSAKREALEVDFEFSGDKVTDAELARLAELGPIESLRLKKTGLTDAGLQHVARLAGLRRLYLEHTAITSAGRKQLAGLKGSLDSLCMVAIVRALVDDHDIVAGFSSSDPDILQVLPPLVVTRDELAAFVDAIDVILTRGLRKVVADFAVKNLKELM